MKYSEYRNSDIHNKIDKNDLCFPLDVMITGVTGTGKSTTLNRIFQKEVAKVGDGVTPETMNLEPYRLSDWLRLWDTPGLGDGAIEDEKHKQKMIQLLKNNVIVNYELYGYIDIVIVIIEGSKRDMWTTTQLLEEVILPHIDGDRVLVAINQADIAMKGRNWNSVTNKPETVLIDFLEDFAISLQNRIHRDTGKRIPKPVYYSAEKGYNVEAFLDLIINHIPRKRRDASDVRIRYGETSDIEITQAAYQYEEGENWVMFSFDKLKNSSSWRETGELKIICWISKEKYSFGDSFVTKDHYIVDEKWIGHLNGGDSIDRTDFYFTFPTKELPIKGRFCFVFTINELSDDGNWYIIDYCNSSWIK